MLRKKPESRLVRSVMPNASEPETQEATERWFRFLNAICDIAQREERLPDSQDPEPDGIVEGQTNGV